VPATSADPNGAVNQARIAALRADMPALANKAYFNYGGQGPLPDTSLEAINAAWRTLQELGPFTADTWPFVEATTARLRQRLAHWCGVGAHRISLTENVTSGCVLPLWGLPWQADDELLISDCEHPGVVAACQELARRQGLSVSTLPVRDLSRRHGGPDLEDALLQSLEQALSPRTRLVVLSHLLWNTGALLPIEQVAVQLQAHPRRPWLLVDAAQSMGSVPVASAAHAADLYAFTGHKWCCGPEGLGGVVLSERVLADAQPTLIGWRSLGNEAEAGSGWHRDGRRFEVATSCLPLQAGLDSSLQRLEAIGTAEQRLAAVQATSRLLWSGLQQIQGITPLLAGPPEAGLVSFTIDGRQPETVVKALGAQGTWIRSLDDPHCLRACTHLTTTAAEIEHLLGALTNLPGQGC
jgi:L-cysteine/cystine lyase